MDLKKKATLSGNIVSYIDTDRFKVNDLWVSFGTPLSRDTAALNALLPLVLSRGTTFYPDMASISKKLDSCYAATVSPRIIKRAENQYIGFRVSMLDNSYALDDCDISGEVISVLRQMITDPVTVECAFRPEYVEGEKKVLRSYIQSEINNKRRYADLRCIANMCADEAYGISEYGAVEEVDAITPSMLWDHYKKVLSDCRPDTFYVGRYSARTEDCLSDLLDDLSGKNSGVPACIKRKATEVKRINEDQPVRQGKLSMGFRTSAVLSDPDYHKFTVFNVLFGSSPISKLFMNVREKLSLAYYCSSTIDPLKGVMLVSAGIDVKNRELAEGEIMKQLESTARGDITDAELDAAKAVIVNSYREAGDSPSALENWYSCRMLAGRSDSPAENAERIMAVTKEDVAEAASRITPDTIYFMNPTLTGEEDDSDE